MEGEFCEGRANAACDPAQGRAKRWQDAKARRHVIRRIRGRGVASRRSISDLFRSVGHAVAHGTAWPTWGYLGFTVHVVRKNQQMIYAHHALPALIEGYEWMPDAENEFNQDSSPGRR
jgi:hypothetical protein